MFNIVYIAQGINSAFNSQVKEYLNSICALPDIESVSLVLGYKKKPQVIDDINSKIAVHWYKDYYQYPFIIRFSIAALKKCLTKVKINGDSIIHVRSDYSAYLFTEATKNIYNSMVLVDIRATPFEAQYYLSSSIQLFFKRLLIKKFCIIFNKPLVFTAVSNSLKTHLIRDFKVLEDRITVVPCIGGDKFYYNEKYRLVIREQLNLSDHDILFIFATGSDRAWQRTEDIIELVKNVHPRIKILVLSNKKFTLERVISMKVSYSKVPLYLNAADVGIIIRDRNIVNTIACPIKFIEYQSVGLPVIANDSVDFITSYIEEHRSGLIIGDDLNLDFDKINELLLLDKSNISQLALLNFNINVIANKYMSIYKMMHSKNI